MREEHKSTGEKTLRARSELTFNVQRPPYRVSHIYLNVQCSCKVCEWEFVHVEPSRRRIFVCVEPEPIQDVDTIVLVAVWWGEPIGYDGL